LWARSGLRRLDPWGRCGLRGLDPRNGLGGLDPWGWSGLDGLGPWSGLRWLDPWSWLGHSRRGLGPFRLRFLRLLLLRLRGGGGRFGRRARLRSGGPRLLDRRLGHLLLRKGVL